MLVIMLWINCRWAFSTKASYLNSQLENFMKLETENNNMSKEKNVETVQVDLNGFEDNTNPVAVPGKIAKAAKKSKVNIPEKSEPVVENEKKQVKKKDVIKPMDITIHHLR